ncbi:MAG: HigA family addiction module antidote protein [Proteobacteria bacterium]|nr:HigA family addiction module antidote protein [Pseudomonadota bacterium]
MAKIHFSLPGSILKRQFLEDFGLSVNAAAKAMGIPRSRLNQIVRGERSISADTALRLGKFFGNGPEFWMNLQTHYDLAEAEASGHKKLKHIPAVQEVIELRRV